MEKVEQEEIVFDNISEYSSVFPRYFHKQTNKQMWKIWAWDGEGGAGGNCLWQTGWILFGFPTVFTSTWTSDARRLNQDLDLQSLPFLCVFLLILNLNILTDSLNTFTGLIQLSSVWGLQELRQGLRDLWRWFWRSRQKMIALENNLISSCIMLKTRLTTTMWWRLQNFFTILAAPTYTWSQARFMPVKFTKWQERTDLIQFNAKHPHLCLKKKYLPYIGSKF